VMSASFALIQMPQSVLASATASRSHFHWSPQHKVRASSFACCSYSTSDVPVRMLAKWSAESENRGSQNPGHWGRGLKIRRALICLAFVGGLCPSCWPALPAPQRREAEIHVNKAQELAQAGDLEAAEAELRRAVELAPGIPSYLASLGTVLALEKKLEESTSVFIRELLIAPHDLTIRRYLAANLWQLRRYPEAKHNLEIILSASPRDRSARLLLGMVSENMKDYTTAAKMLGSVPDEVHERAESVAALARSYYHLGRRAEARATLAQLLSHSAGAQGTFLGAEIADEMGDYETAEGMFTSLEAGFPDQAQLTYRIALVRYHAARFSDSQRTLLDFMATGHESAQLYNLLAWCYYKQNRSGDAVQALQRAIELAPAEETSYLDLAQILTENRSLPSALRAAQKAVALFPISARARALEGVVEARMGQFTDASASYSRALQLDPSQPDTLLGLAQVQFSAGMEKEASASFESGMKRFPHDARFKSQYAVMLLKQSDNGDKGAETRAERLLTSALAIDPSLAEAHYQLGKIRLRKGETSAALSHLQQAAKLDPRNPEIHFALSRAYRRLGRQEEANQQMDVYQKLANPAGASVSEPPEPEPPQAPQ
jgi:tetratricopeptide (TPR) repeat protein